MKNYRFNINKNNKSNTTTFRTNNHKSLDDIIAADIIKEANSLFKNASPTLNILGKNYIKSNGHLIDDAYIDDLYRSCAGDNNKKVTTIIFNRSGLKDNKFINAANFLANYKSNKTHTYALNTLYYTTDNIPVIFYDDEIQIGYETFSYNDFSNIDFLSNLTPKTKKVIIEINIKL